MNPFISGMFVGIFLTVVFTTIFFSIKEKD